MIEIIPGFAIGEKDICLDMGSGYGDAICTAAKVAAHVIALDYNQSLLDHVASRLKSIPAKSFETVLSKGSTVPVPSACVSVVICTEVLEHFEDPERLMEELVRIGKPGCRYLLSVPDANGEHIAKFVAPPEAFQTPNHVRIFERAQFRSLVTDAGLVVEEARFTGAYWTFWWILRHASGTHYHPGLSEPPPEVFVHWERVWQSLASTEEGRAGIEKLDLALPKSQVIVARKLV